MRSLVNTLSGVATLFLSPSEFERYYGGGVSAEHSFERVESGCAACVLAVVGSRQEVLVALRANIKAREKGREPRLLALVEAWMQIAGREEEEREMKAESDTLAEEVRQVRRWMHARRVERRGAEHDDGTRGRSKHRGGLPAGTRIVGGVPMPQVRLHWDGDRQHYDSYRDSYPVGGLDGAEDFEPPSQDEARPEDDWPSGAPPRAPSPFTDDGVGSAGEYAPSHNHRYHEDRPNAQIPEPLFRRRQQHGGESVRDSLDVFSTPKQTGAEGHGQPSQQSTDWGDFYI
ncbi:hypothetical protein C8A01DRAFT_36080 [Parachaetomium inaequale]|uniref:Uncharacterized protein n=1 Tax=Parachaetomium inaequale TaxID=2588326 RepID=A0AAN6PFV5_9PEZI|nr:hypothetical protein C8A01DRAFT_36080 [Parachaetomium inaequale]